MGQYCKFFIVIIVLLIPLLGCAIGNQSVKEIEYYTLEYSPVEITGKKKLPVTIRVERFQISPDYNTDKFVYRDREFKREHYNYHRWRSNPRDMVTYYLARDMAASQLFNGIFTNESLYPASHRVSGTVDEFYEFDNDKWYAVLSLNIIFINTAKPNVDQRVLFQRYYKIKIPCSAKTPFAVAEGMGKAMADVTHEIILDIYENLSKQE